MRDFQKFTNHLKKLEFNPPVIIDVGVAWGTPELYGTFPDAYYILIEALDYFEKDLINIIESKVRGEYHLFGVGEHPEKIQASIDLTHASLTGEQLLDRPTSGAHTFDIEVKTIDEIVRNSPLQDGSLLKLDVQTADLRALRGATETLKKCDIIIIEASLIYSQNLVRDIINYAFKQGFELYEIFGAMNRPYDNAQGQVDLAFVKQGHKLISQEVWA